MARIGKEAKYEVRPKWGVKNVERVQQLGMKKNNAHGILKRVDRLEVPQVCGWVCVCTVGGGGGCCCCAREGVCTQEVCGRCDGRRVPNGGGRWLEEDGAGGRLDPRTRYDSSTGEQVCDHERTATPYKKPGERLKRECLLALNYFVCKTLVCRVLDEQNEFVSCPGRCRRWSWSSACLGIVAVYGNYT